MKKIRVGVLGCANIAARYAIDAFKAIPGVELVAIASRDIEKAKEWSQRYSLEPESYDSLIVRKDIDILYSPLPIGLQEEWVLQAAKNGKHIICEKSITYSYDSAQRMVAVCKENNLALYENFVPEFHPQHAQVLSIIENGDIGTPKVWNGSYGFPPFPPSDIRYSRELKGGSLNDAGCYTLFLARKILGEEPVAVTCVLTNNHSDVDTGGTALIEFPNATALLSFGFDNLYQNTYSVWGSKGLIRVPRAFAIPPSMDTQVELITNDGTKEHSQIVNISAENQFLKSFEYFCGAVANSDNLIKDDMYKRILNQAKTMEAMRISAREGVRVVCERLI